MERSWLAVCAIVLIGLFGCQEERSESHSTPTYRTEAFENYWHAGKAEIAAYRLSQARYGEQRKGRAVLIFVTEDLSKKLQVKVDDPSRGNRINVLKLNFTKKFITGIYPYSLMLSVFTPVQRDKNPSSLKVSMSSQEWCGHVYTQLNLRGNRYAVKSHSYFEQEADEQFSVRHAFLEDEIWNRIRLDHESLPVGDVRVIPGLFHTRLNHTEIDIRKAVAERTETDTAHLYTVVFPQEQRSLAIAYEKQFPFRILGWRERWKEHGVEMETAAVLDKTLYTDYWMKNSNEYLHLRDTLNLPNPFQ